jgi:lipopolysaccharide/colanic/teichoic acid biosynthesis glycosyltransferase
MIKRLYLQKRIFDILLSFFGIIVLSIPIGFIALLIYLSSHGEIFFRQKRVGLWGRDFTLYKFRTMTVFDDASKGRFDVGDSSRVTPLGKILRKTKLDELPQLWNVLIGDMSFVGPRPEVRKWVEVYPERWEKVHRVRPGITDPASIRYRNEEEILAASPDPETTYKTVILPQKLDLYEDYIKHQTFIRDILIIFQTLFSIVTR